VRTSTSSSTGSRGSAATRPPSPAASPTRSEAGDAVAHGIVETAGRRLGDYARVCAARTGQLGSPFPLVLTGGVMRHPSLLLRAAIHERVPDGVAVYPDIEPVVGALLLAADHVGTRPDRDRLRAASAAVLGAR
jgi:N-acetylglucosamine kinase-like BadF-type ATPase